MTQFFCNESCNSSTILINTNEVNHIVKSFRIRKNETIKMFNGKGCVCIAQVIKINKNELLLKIIEKKIYLASDIQIYVYQNIIKLDKFEFALEKCTELGADVFVPLITERTEITKKGISAFLNKYSRFKKILLESAKQSDRVFLPKIKEPKFLEECFEIDNKNELNIVAFKNEKSEHLFNFVKKIENVLTSKKIIKIFVGPVGDFSLKDINILEKQNNIYFVNLGENVLKSETASMFLTGVISILCKSSNSNSHCN